MELSPIPAGLSGGNKTRLQHERTLAAQAAMGGNISAQNSFHASAPRKVRPQTSVDPNGSGGAPVGSPQVNPIQQQAQAPAQQVPNNLPQGHPMAPAPIVPAQHPVDKMIQDQALNKIINSPEMMETVTKLKLRNYFHGKPDDNLGVEAMGMMQRYMP